jgi:addiction module RelE/StbE family toxin
MQDPTHPTFHNHALLGKYDGFRSINVTSDYHIVFEERENGDVVLLLMIGTHAQLYGK